MEGTVIATIKNEANEKIDIISRTRPVTTTLSFKGEAGPNNSLVHPSFSTSGTVDEYVIRRWTLDDENGLADIHEIPLYKAELASLATAILDALDIKAGMSVTRIQINGEDTDGGYKPVA